ncbi:GntR family transcriptional regulator [Streptomyces aureoversilis]|uniref:GntR family transcriptional regulator n=1 Tax=Streptomyces aureoversilis TaxID=67277 RepID=A0ABV9ZUJ6_9ACTN
MEFDPKFPKWTQIADVIRKRITSGEYPLDHLISEVKLEQEFGVARITVRKVMAGLRKDGLIVTSQGMGSFVIACPVEPTRASAHPSAPAVRQVTVLGRGKCPTCGARMPDRPRY